MENEKADRLRSQLDEALHPIIERLDRLEMMLQEVLNSKG
jgi:hypothetical protein